MYICICNAVTDQQIRESLDQGARNLHDLQKTLQVGTQCGSCCCHARSLVEEYHACKAKSDHSTSFPSSAKINPIAI